MNDINSPFKFLNPYNANDIDVFFGRDDEIEELYEMIFETNLLLVYGPSGSGKTSLIQCGLASKFKKTDWFDISIRHRGNINDSLKEELRKNAKTPIKPNVGIVKAVESLFLDYFKPIYLIFDQFEELFILGTKEERDEFVQDIKKLLAAELSCKIIIIMREEYIAQLYDFEKVIPHFFNKRIRVESMSFVNVEKVIKGSAKKFKITLSPEEETTNRIIDNIKDKKSGRVQLTYLQLYLDRLYKKANGTK